MWYFKKINKINKNIVYETIIMCDFQLKHMMILKIFKLLNYFDCVDFLFLADKKWLNHILWKNTYEWIKNLMLFWKWKIKYWDKLIWLIDSYLEETKKIKNMLLVIMN